MNIDFSTLPLWLNKPFYPLWFDHNRFIVLKGGAGSGKSVDTFRRLVYRLVAEPGHNYLIARKSAKSNSTSTYPLTKSCIADWNFGHLFHEHKTTQTLTSKTNGNQVKFIGLDDMEKIKSITFDSGPLTDIIIEEATEITERDFRQLNLRLRGQTKQPFQISLLFNPVSDTHWMKNAFFDNPGGKKNHMTIHQSTYKDNRFIDAPYKEELENLKYEDRVYYEIYALGNWGSVGNLVFRNIRYSRCPYTDLEDFDEVLAGMDFGYNHYHSNQLLGLKDGVKYSFDELYVRHMTNDEIIIENEAKNVLTKTQKCTADSAEPKSIKDWSNAGYNIIGAKKGPDSVRQQISWLNRGEWVIDPEQCPGLASETKSYKWKEDRDGNVLDEPVKFKDDAIAACRYAIEEKTEYEISMLDVL